MAARIRKVRNDDEHRLRIQTTQLLKRLTDHALGLLENEMKPTQVTAALGLLKKTLPDLTAVEHSGEITTPKVIRGPEVSKDADTWIKEAKSVQDGPTTH